MSHGWRPGRGREKSNRVAMKSWGATFRLLLLRAATGVTVVTVCGYGADRLADIMQR